jgi:ABC-type arginine transport system permease subunit
MVEFVRVISIIGVGLLLLIFGLSYTKEKHVRWLKIIFFKDLTYGVIKISLIVCGILGILLVFWGFFMEPY